VPDSLKRLGYTLGALSARGGLAPEAKIEKFLQRARGRWQSINVLAVHPKSTARLDWIQNG
jgi:hypothetical protein